MAKRKAGPKKAKQATDGQNGGVVALTKELFQAAITLRGSVEPADYKRYVLPIIFLRFLSLRYDRRRAELEALVADKKSDYFGDKKAIHDPDEYRRVCVLRRVLNEMNAPDAMELLVTRLGKTKSNAEFLMSMNMK